MLLIMVTVVGSGVVEYAGELDVYSPIIDEFERVCGNYTGEGKKRARVTLWDTERGLSHGARDLNAPKMVVPTTEEVHKWIRDNCDALLQADKKIQTIKETRTKFYSEDPAGYRMGLKEAKEHVEAVMAEDKAARLQSLTAPCGSSYCTNYYCDCY